MSPKRALDQIYVTLFDDKKLDQGLLYTGTDFLPNQISKKRPKSHFNANKSGVAQIPHFI